MLNDLKVLELASVLAGPSVGNFLPELGAEVIKIENPKSVAMLRADGKFRMNHR